ncbi:MAG: hypothetical protein MJ069_08235 [Salinivirgaceae bacterium]|nr:hypothetical protein [Salinivirgaceae bacterium]
MNCLTLIATLALLISIVALLLVIRLSVKFHRDSAVATEEYQLMLESTKSTLSRDIKNLRKEIRSQIKSKTASESDNEEVAE